MKKTILSVLIILSLFIISCDENSTSPQRSEKQTIKVIDETGNPIPKVEVTFLYNNDNSYYQPTPTNSKTFLPKINKLSNAATPFKLYQNIPNPVSAITHIRFRATRDSRVSYPRVSGCQKSPSNTTLLSREFHYVLMYVFVEF